MKKVLVSLLFFSFLTACADSSSTITDNNLNNSSYISSKSSKLTRNIFPIIEKVNQEYKKRNPELIEIKYKAMSESAFAFYRATAYLFYSDITQNSLIGGTKVNISGDLHLDNIGTYFASNGKVYYDLNDFDDVTVASYTYDLSRCITSIYLAAEDAGFNKEDSENIVTEFLTAYKSSLNFFNLNKSSINQPVTDLSKYAQKAVDKTLSNSYSNFLSEISANNKFIYSDKIRKINPEVTNTVLEAIKVYSSSNKTISLGKVKDIGMYIAGKGSLGRYRYIVLLEGNTTKSNDDLVLELKEAALPSISQLNSKSTQNEAQRVIQANKYFLSYPDTYLGSTTMNNLNFFVRKVNPDEKVNTKKIDKKSDFKDHIKTVAKIVAKAHAKSGKTLEILKEFENKSQLINDFSKDYTNQVKADFQEFKKSI